MKRTIIFYRTVNNKCPVKNFLDSLSGKVSQKVTWVLSLIEDIDMVPSKYFKKLIGTKEIWECKVRIRSDSFRIFCFFYSNSLLVLTHGYIKKTQKVPIAEIRRAERYRDDFIRRKRNE